MQTKTFYEDTESVWGKAGAGIGKAKKIFLHRNLWKNKESLKIYKKLYQMSMQDVCEK